MRRHVPIPVGRNVGQVPRSDPEDDLLLDQGLPQILQKVVEKPVRGEDLARQRPVSVFSFGYRGDQGG